MSNITKQGLIVTSEFVEPGGVANTYTGNSSMSYTPSIGSNSTAYIGYWYIPEGTVAGDSFHLTMTLEYSGFDASSTAGTFNIRYQGNNRNKSTGSYEWSGTCPVVGALAGATNLKTLVLSQTSGIYIYDLDFVVSQTYLDTWDAGRVGIRTDYSNGTATISMRDLVVIPSKYSTQNTSTPHIETRVGDNFITANKFIEW